MSSRETGVLGEDLALRYLARKGYELVERNYRTRHGEIDLILRDTDTLVFVEVKARRGRAFGDPLEAVTPGKQARVRMMAEAYLAEKDMACVESRLDAVGVLISGGRSEVRHVEDAF